MKRVIWIIPAILLLSFTARAQETPSWEISGGYSYLDANLNGSHFHLNGGGGSVNRKSEQLVWRPSRIQRFSGQ